MRKRVQTAEVLLLLALALSIGCGGGPAATPPAAGAQGATPPATTAPAPGARNRCPLDNGQVAKVLGVQVNALDGLCGFSPGGDLTIQPSVLYVAQVTFACAGTNPAEAGFTERYEGLGTPAHLLARGSKTTILVCREGDPFEVVVDARDGVARDAAIALARQVLAR